ncbi:MAG: hypothetical protein JSS27_14000 [Planctomycetes bacterium]|nr:hypothetical protein [Planctomycetota bacterium]
MVATLLGLAGCSARPTIETVIANVLATPALKSAKVVRGKDDHYNPEVALPGGISDGRLDAMLQLSEAEHVALLANIERDLAAVEPVWHKLPLPADFVPRDRAFLLEGSEGFSFPRGLKRGYYFFRDYQTRVGGLDKGKPWHARHSFNYAIAIYDEAERTLYFLMLDT